MHDTLCVKATIFGVTIVQTTATSDLRTNGLGILIIRSIHSLERSAKFKQNLRGGKREFMNLFILR